MPYGLIIEPAPEVGFVVNEPPDRRIAGQLSLPFLNGKRLGFVDLWIPSNGRFTQEDLRLLWATGSELAAWRSARIALARRDGTFGRPEIAGSSRLVRDWRALTACAHEAADLLGRWPTTLDRRLTWLPVGVPGGTEDLLTTERLVERRGYLLARDAQTTVTQSGRWVGRPRPLTSPTVSGLARAVIEVAQASLPADQLMIIRSLLARLAEVSSRAASPAGYRDPDLSSWPRGFVSFVASCVVAIAELQSFQRGTGVVPLLDTDELYEAWLAVEVRKALDGRFGPWMLPGSGALARWEHGGIAYELWLKPGIRREGRLFGDESFRAVVAEVLIPDLVLSATMSGMSELYLLDAKAWAQMLPEDVLMQAAKYLYGVRREHDVHSMPAVVGVELVTCAQPPSVSDKYLAKLSVTTATPTIGIDGLATRLTEIVDQLADSLLCRERVASRR